MSRSIFQESRRFGLSTQRNYDAVISSYEWGSPGAGSRILPFFTGGSPSLIGPFDTNYIAITFGRLFE